MRYRPYLTQRRIAILLLVFLLAAFVIRVHIGRERGYPLVKRQGIPWAIGIYTGKSPFIFSDKKVHNPVLTAKDVKDVPAKFVADPFMLYDNRTWYLFFEVMNAQTNQGDIGLATSKDGLHWTYRQIVLDEPFHLSYPYVFKGGDGYYMIPSSREAQSIRLYKAVVFPTQWSFIGTLLKGSGYVDSSIFYYKDKWWLFTSPGSPGHHHTLCLYYADELMGPWIEHPKSPIVKRKASTVRSGGRVLVLDDQIVRYAQDDRHYYGHQVRAFRIIKLTTTSYEEEEVKESPILKPGIARWNNRGMHNIDPHQIDKNEWIACVDGEGEVLVY